MSSMLLFSTGTTDRKCEFRDEYTFRQLTKAEIRDAEDVPFDIRNRQIERLSRFNNLCCYGAFKGNDQCSFAWLLRNSEQKRDETRLFTLSEGTAEITAAETLPEFRGNRLYSYVINNLCFEARNLGIAKVFAKTQPDNVAAIKSFSRCELQFEGTIYFVNGWPGRKKPAITLKHILSPMRHTI